ncbi:peptidase inhibitor family I36 protein [Streptomyces sp. NPDC047461]|uniref:peptidase inhibitor family I36 protein n=1 Tax=Streptomyces sp. NPDC047461 TaxID=3155619 RepID=UPI00340C185C
MRNERRRRRSTGIAIAVLAFCGSSALAPVSAADVDPLQQQIDAVLAKTEGGVQISRNEIAWDEGQAIMAFPFPGETQAPPSSEAAQELQAQVTGLPLDTRETSPDMLAYDSPTELADAVAADETIPEDETESGATATDACPTEIFGNDWYCFYQYKNFGGRRLQWNAVHTSRIFFSKYDFENRTSSWSNKGGLTINVLGRTTAGLDTSCWHLYWYEVPHERSASARYDNAADCFTTSSS